MVDMLVESSNNVEMILKFFDMFLKLKDLTSTDTFKEYDPDGKGIISKRDFHKAMESHKHYTQSETEFLLSCAETDENETLDYEEFVKRFHEPAKDIGFNVAVLLTNLSEHMPNDTRLQTFLELAESVLNYFQPFLGRIEIMGSAKRIERVYFEISESSRTQWEKPQVKESKRQFIFDVVNEGGEKEKMELFVNFCEDTIFEMQLAAQISESDLNERSANKEESEKERPEEQGPRMGFFSLLTIQSALFALRYNVLTLVRTLSLKSLKKQMKRMKKMTVKDMVTAFFSSYWRVFVTLLHFVASVCRGFFRIVSSLLLGGSLVEGAKKIKVAELLANMPDPTQDEVRGDEEEGERKSLESALPSEDLTDLKELTEESDLLSDIFGLDLKREGGQYKLIPHNPNAGLSDLMTNPMPVPEVQEKFQVLHFKLSLMLLIPPPWCLCVLLSHIYVLTLSICLFAPLSPPVFPPSPLPCACMLSGSLRPVWNLWFVLRNLICMLHGQWDPVVMVSVLSFHTQIFVLFFFKCLRTLGGQDTQN